ncbi:unnamed protein product [Thlaspi arvense]|uniref:C2H2-type domain-containing protein n=1 Tax=Thlaspi arvense TaxID=13288 RepID=A0AAU9RHN2_THLAR|nr:unnamed protein product [Thlaspi arvense]
MDRCPIPDGYDAGKVGPCIKSELEKLSYSGPLTIFGVGDLERIPDHVLQALFSTTGMTCTSGYNIAAFSVTLIDVVSEPVWFTDAKYRETGKFVCKLCRFDCESFEQVTNHLKGEEHTRMELELNSPQDEAEEDEC